MIRRPPRSPLFPSTPLFRSRSHRLAQRRGLPVPVELPAERHDRLLDLLLGPGRLPPTDVTGTQGRANVTRPGTGRKYLSAKSSLRWCLTTEVPGRYGRRGERACERTHGPSTPGNADDERQRGGRVTAPPVRHVSLRSGVYADSVRLMQVSRDVGAREGVTAVLVAMATPLNLELAAGMGLAPAENASPDRKSVV